MKGGWHDKIRVLEMKLYVHCEYILANLLPLYISKSVYNYKEARWWLMVALVEQQEKWLRAVNELKAYVGSKSMGLECCYLWR